LGHLLEFFHAKANKIDIPVNFIRWSFRFAKTPPKALETAASMRQGRKVVVRNRIVFFLLFLTMND
jgi:hypothetical protein